MTIPPIPPPPPPVHVRTTAHKAWVGAALGAGSAIAGLLVEAMVLIKPEDVCAATGASPERVHAWWKIILAILTVLAAAGATGGAVYRTRNRPIP